MIFMILMILNFLFMGQVTFVTSMKVRLLHYQYYAQNYTQNLPGASNQNYIEYLRRSLDRDFGFSDLHFI